jgi:hypothetical protein
MAVAYIKALNERKLNATFLQSMVPMLQAFDEKHPATFLPLPGQVFQQPTSPIKGIQPLPMPWDRAGNPGPQASSSTKAAPHPTRTAPPVGRVAAPKGDRAGNPGPQASSSTKAAPHPTRTAPPRGVVAAPKGSNPAAPLDAVPASRTKPPPNAKAPHHGSFGLRAGPKKVGPCPSAPPGHAYAMAAPAGRPQPKPKAKKGKTAQPAASTSLVERDPVPTSAMSRMSVEQEPSAPPGKIPSLAALNAMDVDEDTPPQPQHAPAGRQKRKRDIDSDGGEDELEDSDTQPPAPQKKAATVRTTRPKKAKQAPAAEPVEPKRQPGFDRRSPPVTGYFHEPGCDRCVHQGRDCPEQLKGRACAICHSQKAKCFWTVDGQVQRTAPGQVQRTPPGQREEDEERMDESDGRQGTVSPQQRHGESAVPQGKL